MKTALAVMKGIKKSVPSLKNLADIIVIILGRMMFVAGVEKNGGKMTTKLKLKRKDFIEMPLWVITCPFCSGDIVIEVDPGYEEDCSCEHCERDFKLED